MIIQHTYTYIIHAAIGKPIRLFPWFLENSLGSNKRSDLHKFMTKYLPDAMTAVLIAGSIIEGDRQSGNPFGSFRRS
jgi:hypothetical protein